MFLPDFNILGTVIPETSVTKHFIGEKENWTNKGNAKHKDAESLLNDTSNHTHSSHRLWLSQKMISL